MKFSLERSLLNDRLASLLNVVPLRSNILSIVNILVEVKTDKVIFRATDLIMNIIFEYEGQFSEETSFMINAKKFGSILKAFKEGLIDFDLAGDVLTLSQNELFFKLRVSLDVIDFPRLPKVEENTKIIMDPDKLLRAITKTEFIVENETVFGVMPVIALNLIGETFVANSYQGYIFGKYTYILKGEEYPKLDLVIDVVPLKNIARLLKMYIQDNIELIIGKSFVKFIYGEYTIYLKLSDAKVADVSHIFRYPVLQSVKIKKDEILIALSTLSTITDKISEATIRFYVKDNFLTLETSGTNEFEKGVDTIPCENDGKDLRLDFKFEYIYQIIQHIDSEYVYLRYKSDEKNENFIVLVEGADHQENEYYVYLLTLLFVDDDEDS